MILDQIIFYKKKIDINNINEHLLSKPEKDWDKFESIICEPINVKGVKKCSFKLWRASLNKINGFLITDLQPRFKIFIF